MWQPSVRTFRWFTIVALITHVVIVIDGVWSILPTPPDFIAIRDVWAGEGSLLTYDQHNRAWWLSICVTALALVGMLALSDWARWTALFVTVFNLVWPPMAGTILATPWNSVVCSIWNVGFFVALAIAFLSPVALHFTGQAEISGTTVEDE